jgi:Ca2+-binding RTX toxin-like protein
MALVREMGIVCALFALVAVAPGCVVEEEEDTESLSEALKIGAIQKGAGAGPAMFENDPCEHPAAFAKKHGYNLIVAKPNEHKIDGTEKNDLIVGTPGNDSIWAKGGDDIVCAGDGEDTVYGGDGNDYIDGGGDNDTIHAGKGNDLVHGRGGSDTIYGGPGDDLLFGDILDDKIFGEAGDDLLIGGHGTDILDGGAGNDYMRGDTGNDAFDGGPGQDVVSFVTAMPPGQGMSTGTRGVKIDFTDRCTDTGIELGRNQHDGCANGDGGNEPMDDVEYVIGSPYDDIFTPGNKGVKFIDVDGRPAAANGKVYATLDEKARDTGLIVIGTDKGDDIEIIRDGNDFVVKGKGGTKIFAGPGCKAAGDDARCEPDKHVLRYVAGFMDDGGDVVKVAEAAETKSKRFPLDITVHVSGGDGDDWLHGGDEEDVFFSGPTGKDHLFGHKGDDALLSESRKYPKMAGCTPAMEKTNPRCTEDKPKGGQYDDGKDELWGGPGDDQLVADYPCGKHEFHGGGGTDIAGFARSGRFPIKAQLGGKAAVETSFHGRAFNPDLCGKDDGTFIAGDLEILEAADGDDELWGNDKPNQIWGREGDDEIHGLGGNDVIKGAKGKDRVFGGAGRDVMNVLPEDTAHQDAN